MSIYRHDEVGANKNLYLSACPERSRRERSMYGSSRIGVENIDQVVASTLSGNVNIVTRTQRYVGDKRFELSNHLGNVLNTVTDRKLPVAETVYYQCHTGSTAATSANNITASTVGISTQMTLEAWIKTTETTGTHAIASYYLENTTNRGGILQMVSGKMQFVGRIGTTTTYTSGSGTTNVADGKWHHVVGTVDNGVWKVYVDGQLESTSSTSVAGNFTGLVQQMNVGRVNTTGTTYTSWAKACIKEVSMWNYTKAAAEIETNFEDYVGYTGSETGLKGYWKVSEGSGTNYDDVTSQSNDLTTTGSPSWSNDAMVDYYTADVQSYSDYFPFGMMLPGRNGSSADYEYGFNGMRKDNEIKGDNNSYDFGARIYDPRIGKFLSRDPREKQYPFMSPYCFAANNPILFIDENGEGPIYPFQSLFVSAYVESQIRKYDANEISYKTLMDNISIYIDQPFTEPGHADWAITQFDNSGLDMNYNLTDPRPGNFTFSAPPIAYKEGENSDPFTYIVLIEEDESGKWIQAEYKIKNPLAAYTQVGSLNNEIAVYNSRLSALDEEIANKERQLAGFNAASGGAGGRTEKEAGSSTHTYKDNNAVYPSSKTKTRRATGGADMGDDIARLTNEYFRVQTENELKALKNERNTLIEKRDAAVKQRDAIQEAPKIEKKYR